MKTPTEIQQIAAKQIRLGLEYRVASGLKLDREDLPAMCIAEMIALLFALWGHRNILSGFGETTDAIVALIGRDLFWDKPQPENSQATVVQ